MREPRSLVEHLGETRTRLRAVLATLSERELNRVRAGDRVCVGQIVAHVSAVEKSLAAAVLQALPAELRAVDGRDLSGEIDRYDDRFDPASNATGSWTRTGLLALLDESRFKYVQAVFNKAHATELAGKAMQHPVFGPVSLKSVMDFIWQHEQRHIDQIAALATELGCASGEAAAGRIPESRPRPLDVRVE